MPVMDGLPLLAELRARRSTARAVIVSAYGDMTNIRTAMNRGAFDFVTKPVDLNDLEVTIDKTLETIAYVRGLDRERADAERARANLARYFSPNIVDLLADSDEPLGPVRRQTVGVLFVDIVGFTRMAEAMTPEAVVATEHTLACAVIGDTVNVASRLQSLTRDLKTPLVVADAIVKQIGEGTLPIELQDQGDRELRGRSGTIRIWTPAR